MSDTPLTPLSEEQLGKDGAQWAVGQLRHLYKQMIAGPMSHPAEAARGLLGPAIEALEPLLTRYAQRQSGTPPNYGDGICADETAEGEEGPWVAPPPPEKPSSQADAVREALLDAIAIIRAEIEDYHNEDCDCPLCMKVAAAGWDDMAQSPEQIVAALTPSPARDNQLPKGDG